MSGGADWARSRRIPTFATNASHPEKAAVTARRASAVVNPLIASSIAASHKASVMAVTAQRADCHVGGGEEFAKRYWCSLSSGS